jgi:hypothetical protein
MLNHLFQSIVIEQWVQAAVALLATLFVAMNQGLCFQVYETPCMGRGPHPMFGTIELGESFD